jgi:hypothetical protein
MKDDKFPWEEFENSRIWLILTAFVVVCLICIIGGCGGSADPTQQISPLYKKSIGPQISGTQLRCNEAPEAPACPASSVTTHSAAN